MLHSFRLASGCAVCGRRAVSRDAGGRFADSRHGRRQCLHRAGTPGPGGFRQFGPHGAVPGSIGRGARLVYVSSRPKTRWKGFRWRRMRLLDRALDRTARISRRSAHRMATVASCDIVGKPRVLFLDALHEPVDLAGTADLQQQAWDVPGTLCRTMSRRGRGIRFRRGRRPGIPASRPGARCKSSGNRGGSAWPANM